MNLTCIGSEKGMKKGKKIKNLKKNMEKIKYEMDEYMVLQTDCPYGVVSFLTNRSTKVGSCVCTRFCKHFVSNDETKQVVECSYGKNNK